MRNVDSEHTGHGTVEPDEQCTAMRISSVWASHTSPADSSPERYLANS